MKDNTKPLFKSNLYYFGMFQSSIVLLLLYFATEGFGIEHYYNLFEDDLLFGLFFLVCCYLMWAWIIKRFYFYEDKIVVKYILIKKYKEINYSDIEMASRSFNYPLGIEDILLDLKKDKNNKKEQVSFGIYSSKRTNNILLFLRTKGIIIRIDRPSNSDYKVFDKNDPKTIFRI